MTLRTILHKLKAALGLVPRDDLREACIRHVRETMGDECVPEFVKAYDNINRGVPNDMLTTMAVIEIVETVKKQLAHG